MNTINFHHILTNMSNLFRQIINTHHTCMFKKFLLSQAKLFQRAVLPQIHWARGMVRNTTWPYYQVSISLWFQTHVQKLPTLWACWCKLTKRICLTHLLLSIFCDLHDVNFASWSLAIISVFCCVFYTYHIGLYILIMCTSSCVLLFVIYLTETVKLPFMRVNLHLSVIWYFPPCFFCHTNICIVKQMYINFNVLSTSVKLNISS